jgi:hypothetical protein
MAIISGPSVTGTASNADSSLTHTENLVPRSGSAVRRLVMTLGGTNMTLANVTRVTVKANGALRCDAPPAQWRAMLGFYGKKAEWSSSGSRLTIPLDFFMGMGAPANQLLRVEIAKNATPSGTVTSQMHEIIDDQSPVTGSGYFLSATNSLGASATSQPVQINAPGILLGMVIPDVANITLLRIKGPQGTIAEWTSSAAIIETYEMYRGTTAVTEVFLPVPPTPILAGQTLLEVSTGAGYSTSSEWAFLTQDAPAK